jgi:osmotically inducible protein OsmC
MKRAATAVWDGDLKGGEGTISGESGAFEGLAYSFKTRFEDEPGTNPEELIAAAHAGCFSMAFANELARAGMNPQSVSTTATVTLGKDDKGPAVTDIHLEVKAYVPGADKSDFDAAANAAKTGCPISKLLRAANITMNAALKG